MDKTQNNKILVLALALILLSVLASSSVHAAVTDNIFNKLGNFVHAYDTYVDEGGRRDFSGSYSTERKILDGFLFFMLFLSMALLGLRKWYGKSTAAVNGMAISIAALMTLAILAFTDVTIGLLFPFAKNILFFAMWLVIFGIVSKNEIIKSKFLAMLLALLLTFVLFNVEGLIEDKVKGEPLSITQNVKDLYPGYNYNQWKYPPAVKCNEIGEKCQSTSQCCQGLTCQNGYCANITATPTITTTGCSVELVQYINQYAGPSTGMGVCIGKRCICNKTSQCTNEDQCAQACGFDMTKKNKVEVGGWVGVIGSISIAGPGIGVNDIGVGQISKVGVSSQQECEGVVPPTTTGNNCKGNYGDNVDCRKITDCPTTKPSAQYTGTYPAVDGNTYYYIAGKCSGSFSTGYCCFSTNAPGNPPWTEPGRKTAPTSESARVKELKGMVGDKYNLAMYQTVYDKYSTTEKARSILKGMGITSKFTSLSQWESTVNKMSAESYKQFKTMVERTIK